MGRAHIVIRLEDDLAGQGKVRVTNWAAMAGLSKTLGSQNLAIGNTDHPDMAFNNLKGRGQKVVQPLWSDQADHGDHSAGPANLG